MEIQLTITGAKTDTEFSTDSSDWDKAKVDFLCGCSVLVERGSWDCPECWDGCEHEIECWDVVHVGEGKWELTGGHSGSETFWDRRHGEVDCETWSHDAEPRTITTAQLRTILKGATKN